MDYAQPPCVLCLVLVASFLCYLLLHPVFFLSPPPGGSFSAETEQKFDHFSGLTNNKVSTR